MLRIGAFRCALGIWHKFTVWAQIMTMRFFATRSFSNRVIPKGANRVKNHAQTVNLCHQMHFCHRAVAGTGIVAHRAHRIPLAATHASAEGDAPC